jgi:hypothetical protein
METRVAIGSDNGLRLEVTEDSNRVLKLELAGSSTLWNVGIDFPCPVQSGWRLRLGPNRHPNTVVMVLNDDSLIFGQIRQQFIELLEQECQQLTSAPRPARWRKRNFEQYITRYTLVLAEIQQGLELQDRLEAGNLFRSYSDLDHYHLSPFVQPALF